MAKQYFSMTPAQIAKVVGTVGSPLIVVSELIKNAVDASAKKIDVYYDNENKIIAVENDYKGFSSEEIQALSTPGSSAKKNDSNLTNDYGMYLTGSKGLGLLSVFLLSDETEILTAPSDKKIHKITLNKSTGAIEDVVINQQFETHFTRVTIKNVTQETLQFLASSSEVRKLRHISSNLYKADKIPFPKMFLHINGHAQEISFLCPFPPMSYSAEFRFEKKSGTLTFCCTSPNKHINSNSITLKKFDSVSLHEEMLSHYGIKEKILPRTIENHAAQQFDFSAVPTFEGKILVYERNYAGSSLKSYGAGVNVYVNDFALYNYLAEENDWLGLADFSQRKKATRLKPHNVFGYVNFPCFNENAETLQISNERADFIQDVTFSKLMYLIKGVIMFMMFNIDVADKNTPNNHKNDQDESNTDCANDMDDTTNVASDENDEAAENSSSNTNQGETGNDSETTSDSNNESDASETNQSGGPRPGGPAPRAFFETISWHNKLNPSNQQHQGLLFSINELYELSTKNCGRQKAYEAFPVATGMILRTVYEQALRLRLQQVNLWGAYYQTLSNHGRRGSALPTLKGMEDFINLGGNKATVFPNHGMVIIYDQVIAATHRDFLNANIHYPGNINVTPNSLEAIAACGMFALIQGIIDLL